MVEKQNLIERMAQDLRDRAGEDIKKLIQTRNLEQTRVSGLEKDLAKTKQRHESLTAKLRDLTNQVAEAATSPSALSKKRQEIEKTKVEARELGEWIQEVEHEALVKARSRVKDAQGRLSQAVEAHTRRVKVIYEGEMTVLLDEFMRLFGSWNDALRDYQREVGVMLTAGSVDDCLHATHRPFRQYVERVGLGLTGE